MTSPADHAADVLARDLTDPLWPGLTESDWAQDAKALAEALLAAEAQVATLTQERDAIAAALGEPCAECGHIDWRSDGYADGLIGKASDALVALIAMVYVHPCNCGDEIPTGQCARCRSITVLGFDPAIAVSKERE